MPRPFYQDELNADSAGARIDLAESQGEEGDPEDFETYNRYYDVTSTSTKWLYAVVVLAITSAIGFGINWYVHKDDIPQSEYSDVWIPPAPYNGWQQLPDINPTPVPNETYAEPSKKAVYDKDFEAYYLGAAICWTLTSNGNAYMMLSSDERVLIPTSMVGDIRAGRSYILAIAMGPQGWELIGWSVTDDSYSCSPSDLLLPKTAPLSRIFDTNPVQPAPNPTTPVVPNPPVTPEPVHTEQTA